MFTSMCLLFRFWHMHGANACIYVCCPYMLACLLYNHLSRAIRRRATLDRFECRDMTMRELFLNHSHLCQLPRSCSITHLPRPAVSNISVTFRAIHASTYHCVRAMTTNPMTAQLAPAFGPAIRSVTSLEFHITVRTHSSSRCTSQHLWLNHLLSHKANWIEHKAFLQFSKYPRSHLYASPSATS